MNDHLDIIIPSAILVPEELQNIGKLPAIIYPINQKIVFDYLYDQYKEINGSIKIICYKNKEKVHRRLSSYKDNKIYIKDLPELNDLGHTIYYALEEVKNSVLINFSDTIIMDNVLSPNGDVIFYSESNISETWTFFDIKNGQIKNIYDKKETSFNEIKKLFVGLFRISNPLYFRECLQNAFNNKEISISTFYYALKLYSQSYPMSLQRVENWFDIGHIDTYYNSNLEVKAREFNHILVDKNRGILKKTSEDKNKFIGEILWYLKLPADIEYARPRIFSYSTDYSSPFIAMEYYAYHTVHELFLNGDLSYSQWSDIFKRILFLYHDFQRYSVSGENFEGDLEDIYLNKTLQRLDKLKHDSKFLPFFNQSIIVNGKKYKSLNNISNILKNIIPIMLYDVRAFNIIHGDLCFSNIMIDSNFSFIKVIDPRGKFGSFDIYGDSRYELAKLFHSVDGKYDFIIKDLFILNYDLDNSIINYQINDRKKEFDLYELFLSIFKNELKNDLKKIELIEALLFISMIPLHKESFNHQLVMLATGLEILDRVIDIKEGDE